MKEIGQKLKEKREENGVSVEEAAEDLKLRPSQITSVENGNTSAFQDMALLKYFVRDYAKYLGLDTEEILDDFNEFMFDFTSKIPVAEIEQAKKEKQKQNVKKVSSPYTTIDRRKKIPKFIIIILLLFVTIIVGYIVVSSIKGNDFNSDNITYAIRR